MLRFDRREHENANNPVFKKKTQQCQRNWPAFFFDPADDFPSFKGFKKNRHGFQQEIRQGDLLFFKH